jgi:hypothetical protein
VGDAYLFARGTEIDPGPPVQPMRTRTEAIVPAGRLVEAPQEDEQIVGSRVELCGQHGDVFAELVDDRRRRSGGMNEGFA